MFVGLTHAEATYDSIRGPMACRWRVESGRLRMEVTVPPNTRATVYVPTTDVDSVLEGGKPTTDAPGVRQQPSQNGVAVFEISGGQYRFESQFK